MRRERQLQVSPIEVATSSLLFWHYPRHLTKPALATDHTPTPLCLLRHHFIWLLLCPSFCCCCRANTVAHCWRPATRPPAPCQPTTPTLPLSQHQPLLKQCLQSKENWFRVSNSKQNPTRASSTTSADNNSSVSQLQHQQVSSSNHEHEYQQCKVNNNNNATTAIRTCSVGKVSFLNNQIINWNTTRFN